MPQLVVPALIVSAVAAVASAAVGTAAAIQQGSEEKKAADYKAKELQQQAMASEQEAALRMSAQDQRAAAALATIRASAAASGVRSDVGSPADVFSTNSEQAQLNAMYTKYAGNLTASGLNAEAALTSYGGRNAKNASYYTAAGDVVSGIGRVGQLGVQYASIK